MPNVVPSLLVLMAQDIGNKLLTVAGLSLLGLGSKPPTPEWGAMLSTAKQFITDFNKWYVVAFPGIMIMLTVFALNLFGDGLRDAFDPRLKD